MSWYNPLFWFSIRPLDVESLPGYLFLGSFLLMAIATIIIKFVVLRRISDKHTKIGLQKIMNFLGTMSFVGLVLIFLSYERTSFLGGKFWYPLWKIGSLVWIIFIIRFFRKDIPVMHYQAQKKEIAKEYRGNGKNIRKRKKKHRK